jgi:hypothetical protein
MPAVPPGCSLYVAGGQRVVASHLRVSIGPAGPHCALATHVEAVEGRGVVRGQAGHLDVWVAPVGQPLQA